MFLISKIPGEELFCALDYCCVIEEGPPENFFDKNDEEAQPADVAPSAIPDAEVTNKLDPAVFTAGNHAKEIVFV